jgi:hypothetical protein
LERCRTGSPDRSTTTHCAIAPGSPMVFKPAGARMREHRARYPAFRPIAGCITSVRSKACARTPVTPRPRRPAGDQPSSTSLDCRLRRLSPSAGGVRGVPSSGGSHPSKHNVQRMCSRRREDKPTRSSCVRLAQARAPGSRLLQFSNSIAPHRTVPKGRGPRQSSGGRAEYYMDLQF